MIADVIANYIDNLEEREFDAPFMALLRGLRFTDIHFLHGPFEFGKDFIAKGQDGETIYQFAFQTKAGDLNLQSWNECRCQIDLLRTNSLAHPAFDRHLPRKAVLVTTGRLVGGAPLAAQEYSEHLNNLGEITFTTWDHETLVQFISESPEVGLTGASTGPLLAILGAVDEGQLTELNLEKFSRKWCTGTEMSLCKAAMEAAVVANRLRRQNRLDLACYVALCLIRASWAICHGSDPPDPLGLLVANTGRNLYRQYALDLFARCTSDCLDPLKFLRGHELHSAHINYPVRCLRIAEIMSLFVLLEQEEGRIAKDVANFLFAFVRNNQGTFHPVSDRWAVSLIPLLLVLRTYDLTEELASALKEVIRWVDDHYDSNGIGLASPSSTPDDEVDYLLGGPFKHVLGLERRSDSYIATVVLDMAAILGMKDIYDLGRNDFLAVNLTLPVIEASDTPGQFLIGGDGLRMNPNMEYSETWDPTDDWKHAPHHFRTSHPYYLERIGRPWDHLAVSGVLRDRHFLSSCIACLTVSK